MNSVTGFPRRRASAGAGTIVAFFIFTLIFNLALLGGAVWVIVWVLQQMGVI